MKTDFPTSTGPVENTVAKAAIMAKKQYFAVLAKVVGTEILTTVARSLSDRHAFDASGSLSVEGAKLLAEVSAEAGKKVFRDCWLTSDIVAEFAHRKFHSTYDKV